MGVKVARWGWLSRALSELSHECGVHVGEAGSDDDAAGV